MINEMKSCLSVLFCSLLLAGVCSAEPAKVAVEKLPLYEYGIVGLAATIPHYRGSDDYQTYVFPLPYFVYRGEIIKADREGIRGIFWNYKQFETDISLSGNPPAEDDKAREGMPDLDAIGEIGPALNYYFYRYGERDVLFLQANLRGAFALDFDHGLEVDHEGWISDFSLIFRDSQLFKEHSIRYHLSGGFQFADADLHNYFYGVSPRFATADRGQYEAEGGYGGFQLSGSILKELTPRLWVSCYGRWMNIDGAVFEDSPLVRTRNNAIVGAMLVWKFGESEALEP